MTQHCTLTFGTIIAILLIGSIVQAHAYVCPSPETLPYCKCTEEYLSCSSWSVTQRDINSLFSSVRRVNNMSMTEWLDVPRGMISLTFLSTLDLTPLAYTRFDNLEIDYNELLTTISGPTLNNNQKGGNALNETLIIANSLYLRTNRLSDASFSNNFLGQFGPHTKHLYLGENDIVGGHLDLGDGTGDIEFIRGLSLLVNLETLSLANNYKIMRVGGGQFKRLGRLTTLDLTLSSIAGLDENAFLIDRANGSDVANCIIDLYHNKLTDDAIHPNLGLETWPANTTVTFRMNNFESLSASVWRPFLLANDGTNRLAFRQNFFYCNDNMRWLRDDREIFEGRVEFAFCENDPGHTIFETEIDLSRPEMKCPPPEQILPCTCTRLKLECSGSNVTQESIDELFPAVRLANNVSGGEWLDVLTLVISRIRLEVLDLKPLFKSRFREIRLEWNWWLTTVFGSPEHQNATYDALLPPPIETRILWIYNNDMRDPSYDNGFLLNFAPYLQELHIKNSLLAGGRLEIEGGGGDIEILKGVGALTNLTVLSLAQNWIRTLGGGQFKRNHKLTILDLQSNAMTGVEEDAFLIDWPTEEELDPKVRNRTINLSINSLVDDIINPNTRMADWPANTTIIFERDHFEFLGQDNWEHFLNARNATHRLQFGQNRFQCDSRMLWLHEGRHLYEDRVTLVNCENDPGHTIFDTEIDLEPPVGNFTLD